MTAPAEGFQVDPALLTDEETDTAVRVDSPVVELTVAALSAAVPRLMLVSLDGTVWRDHEAMWRSVAETGGIAHDANANYAFDVESDATGAAVYLDTKGERHAPMMASVVRIIIEELRRAGVTEAVLRAPGAVDRTTSRATGQSVNPFTAPSEDFRMLKCWLAIRGKRPDGWSGILGWPVAKPVWSTTDDDRVAVAADLSGWLSAWSDHDDATVAVRTPAGGFVSVEPETLRATVTRAVWRGAHVDEFFDIAVFRGHRFRWLTAHFGLGFAAASAGTDDGGVFDWSSEAEVVTDLLRGAGEWCVYGHVQRVGEQYGMVDLEPVLPIRQRLPDLDLVQENDYAEWVSNGHLLDAFGILRLTERPTAETDTTWTWHPIGNQLIGTAGSTTDWFGEDEVDPAALAAARHALGRSV